MSGNHRAEHETSKAGIAVAGALTAGVLLLAGVGAAIATPGVAHAAPPGGGSGGSSGGGGTGGPQPPGGGGGGTTGPGNPGGGGVVGVGNRPALSYPAPLVRLGQTVGDAVFDHNPMLNSTPLGGIYHGLLGASGTPQDTDGILEPGEAYQGAYRGVLNHVLPPNTSANRRNLTSVTNSAGVACVTNVTICK